MHDSILFAGTDYGICRSTNNGTIWVPASGGIPPTTPVVCVAEMDTNIFAGASGGGVYLSSKKGSDWTQVNTGLTNMYVHFLAVSGTNLFVTTNNGIFRTTNNGSNWTPVNTGLPYPPCSALIASGGNIVAGTYTVPGIYLSTNNGANWTLVNQHYTVEEFVVTNTNLFALMSDGVLVSTDNGLNWTLSSSGSQHQRQFRALAVTNAGLIAGTQTGDIYRSIDSGKTWTRVTSIDSYVDTIVRQGSDLYAGTVHGGIFVSTNNGTSWATKNSGLSSCEILSMAVRGTDLFAGTAGLGAFRSNDNGMSWTPLVAGLPGTSSLLLLASGTNLFAWAAYGASVIRSTDNGANWTSIYACPTNTMIHAVAASGSRVFVGTDNGVFLSTDAGATWNAAQGTGLRGYIFDVTISGPNLYVCTSGEGLFYRSADDGLHWTAGNAGLLCSTVNTCLVGEAGIFIGTDNGVYRSIDGGTSWTSASNGLSTLAQSAIVTLAANGTALFAGTYYDGVFSSTDNGSHWRGSNDGLQCKTVCALAVTGTYLFAGTYGGVWSRPISELVSIKSLVSELPTQFTLNQNYPNPFNPNTTIKFELPKASQVSLTVYDILRREVFVLVNERREAGVHEVKFDGSALASGVYFYTPQAGTYVETKKLLLLH